ncbi:MAG TPA: 16S rRNA (cytosine(967)-C(5))-methyltransferase RsmB [Luteimonas sp.]|nr:16S rRNA (cytosine(967)-C(5))-methyltransferase RsmB [Luteimonas sp.]
MTADPGVAARVAATRVLDAVLHRGRSLKGEFATTLPTLADPRDRALVEAIVFAALRQRARYDAALSTWIAKPLGKRDQELRALLFVGFAQLDALGLPPHAAVAATVEAARALGRAHQAGLANALLRRALREGLTEVDASAAWPSWLLLQLRRDWPDAVDAILQASAQPGPLWLRVNRQRTSVADCSERLHGCRIEAAADPRCPDGLRIDAPVPVSALPGFADGEISVQDGSAQLVSDALAPVVGARVLDACSAPGGKAAHLLERDPCLRLTALDVDAARLRNVRATFMRLAVGANAELRVADAVDVANWWDGTPFDAILIDAPCSATGIVRRQPDILLHRRESDLAALTATQAHLLDALWPTLAPGGTLLYATCSILRAENAAQIEAFLERVPDAALEPLDARFGRDTGHGHQRLPGEDAMDGFFYARLRKRI